MNAMGSTFGNKCSRTIRVSAAPSADRKSTRLNSSHSQISYAVFCLKKKTADDDTIEDRDFHSLDGEILWPRVKVAARPLLALLLLMALVTIFWMHFNNAGAWHTHVAVLVALGVIGTAGVLAWNPEIGSGPHVPWSTTLRARAWDLAGGVVPPPRARWVPWRIH